ncbi:MAG: preprotein translocase subunit SecE [Burkholderiaceae bacterium]|nr:preprotein translocase subunit SecE [Burkholderiaceae bacterium]
MNKTDVQTVSSRADKLLVALALALVLVGVVGFTIWYEQPMLVRVGLLLGGIVLGVVVARFSEPGKRFLGFARESYEEAKRVTWPTRDEALKNTGFVFLFVGVMAIVLFGVDKGVEWVLYDVVLGWK